MILKQLKIMNLLLKLEKLVKIGLNKFMVIRNYEVNIFLI
jgi:hypothetical protein